MNNDEHTQNLISLTTMMNNDEHTHNLISLTTMMNTHRT